MNRRKARGFCGGGDWRSRDKVGEIEEIIKQTVRERERE